MSFSSNRLVLQQTISNSIKDLLGTGNMFLDLGLALCISSILGFIYSNLSSIDFLKIIKKWFKKKESKKYIHTIKYESQISETHGWVLNCDMYGNNRRLIIYIITFLEKKNIVYPEIDVILDNNTSSEFQFNTYKAELNRPIHWKPLGTVYYNDLKITIVNEQAEKKIVMSITIESDSMKKCKDFINLCRDEYVEKTYGHLKKDVKKIYYLQHYYKNLNPVFNRIEIAPQKTFDQLFFEEKPKLLKYVNKFMKEIENPTDGKNPKLNILLHGIPGSGKTSIIKALVKYTERHVQYVKISEIQSLMDAYTILFSSKLPIVDGQSMTAPLSDRILVFEDIDAENKTVHKRNYSDEDSDTKPSIKSVDNDKSSGLSLSDVLQLFDGIIEPFGLMMIMTTNHVEALDSALVRPGRINLTLNMGYISQKCSWEMVQYFFPDNSSQEIKEKIHIEPDTIAPCQLEGFCMESDTLDDLETLISEFY